MPESIRSCGELIVAAGDDHLTRRVGATRLTVDDVVDPDCPPSLEAHALRERTGLDGEVSALARRLR